MEVVAVRRATEVLLSSVRGFDNKGRWSKGCWYNDMTTVSAAAIALSPPDPHASSRKAKHFQRSVEGRAQARQRYTSKTDEDRSRRRKSQHTTHAQNEVQSTGREASESDNLTLFDRLDKFEGTCQAGSLMA